MKEPIIRSFKKCGLSVAFDGSKKYLSDHGWHSKLWKMPQRFVEEEFKLLDDNEDEDEDAIGSDENDEFGLLTDQEMIPLDFEQ